MGLKSVTYGTLFVTTAKCGHVTNVIFGLASDYCALRSDRVSASLGITFVRYF